MKKGEVAEEAGDEEDEFSFGAPEPARYFPLFICPGSLSGQGSFPDFLPLWASAAAAQAKKPYRLRR